MTAFVYGSPSCGFPRVSQTLMMTLGVNELADDNTDLEIAVPEPENQRHLDEFDSLIPPMSPIFSLPLVC